MSSCWIGLLVFTRILLLFILLPLSDWVLLVMLLGIHWQFTVLWIILSGVIGAWYVKQQGAQVMDQLRKTLAANQLPTNIIVEGVLLLLAGALMITPGVLTDLFGFSVLFPPCRRWYRKQVIGWFKKRVQIQTYGFRPGSTAGPMGGDADYVDAEVVGRPTDNPSQSVAGSVVDESKESAS